MAITKRMKETTDQSRPQKHPLRQPAVQSRLLLGPASPLGPRPSRAQQLSHLGGITLSPHPHSHGHGLEARQRLGVVPWAASGALVSLSCHSCH